MEILEGRIYLDVRVFYIKIRQFHALNVREIFHIDRFVVVKVTHIIDPVLLVPASVPLIQNISLEQNPFTYCQVSTGYG